MGSLPKTHLSFVLKQHKLSSDFARFGETKGTADGLFRALGPRHGAVDIGSGGPLTPPLSVRLHSRLHKTAKSEVAERKENGHFPAHTTWQAARPPAPSQLTTQCNGHCPHQPNPFPPLKRILSLQISKECHRG